MKIIILAFIIAAVSSFTYAKEFKVDMTGKADISGFTFKDSSKYRLYKSNGYWQSSIGDYGLHKCFGTLKNNTDNDVEFEVYCKYTSQDNEYFIMKFKRDRGFQDSGIGNAKIIETSKKYEYFLNSICNHAITYIDKDYLAIQKCNY